MDYVPEDLIMVSCENGYDHQMQLDAVPNETACPLCGGKVNELEND